MIIGVLCVAAIGAIFVLAFVGLPNSKSYSDTCGGPYGEDFTEYITYEAIKLDKQKALAGNSINYLFDQQVAPKNKECKIPLPEPVGRKFR